MNITEITDYNDPGLDIFVRMNENQLFHLYEPDEGIFIAESPKVIGRALKAGYKPVSMLTEQRMLEKDMEQLLKELGISDSSDGSDGADKDFTFRVLCEMQMKDVHADSGKLWDIMSALERIPLYAASCDVMRKLPGYSLVRGMRCAFRREKRMSPWDMAADVALQVQEHGGHVRIAVIESVMNPTNVGAIFRSAAAMGMDAVIITTDSSDPLYRRAARVSMGTVFQIPWTYADIREWTESGPDMLHSIGFSVVSMALRKDTVDINDPVLKENQKLAIVLGSEGPGLREETIEKSDFTVRIPMLHGVDSLNVAAASAVAFWELGKKRI